MSLTKQRTNAYNDTTPDGSGGACGATGLEAVVLLSAMVFARLRKRRRS